MNYRIDSGTVLLELDRTAIIDVSPGDVLEFPVLDNVSYRWKEQDSQFMESNPGARIFIRVSRHGDVVTGDELLVMPE